MTELFCSTAGSCQIPAVRSHEKRRTAAPTPALHAISVPALASRCASTTPNVSCVVGHCCSFQPRSKLSHASPPTSAMKRPGASSASRRPKQSCQRLRSKNVYMNALLCAGLSSLRKTGWAAALHSALLQPDSLRAPMKSADSRLIHLASWSGSDNFSGLVSPRSYLSCHHARMPPQLLTFHPFSSTFRQTREIRPV